MKAVLLYNGTGQNVADILLIFGAPNGYLSALDDRVKGCNKLFVLVRHTLIILHFFKVFALLLSDGEAHGGRVYLHGVALVRYLSSDPIQPCTVRKVVFVGVRRISRR